jgi:hypothetical protein
MNDTPKCMSFLPAFLKLEWAKQHIHYLDLGLKRFGDSEGGIYRVVIDSDRDPIHDFVRVELVESIPKEVSLMLGDALHNLRAAIDYMWSEIGGKTITAKGKKEFPIYPTRTLLEQFFDARPNEPFLAGIRSVVLDTIQPYKGGNGDALFALNRLNNTDKHELLVPNIQLSRIEHLFVEDSEGRKHGIAQKTFGQTVVWFGGKHGKLKLIDKGRTSFTIVFGKGTLVEGRQVLPTLRHFEVVVNSALEALGTWFESRNVNTP